MSSKIEDNKAMQIFLKFKMQATNYKPFQTWYIILTTQTIFFVPFNRFLDDRLFATCSDDSTVALYDTRNLKAKIRTLRGHSNWVKNIEYSKRDCLLVTSGFDGSIFTWDLNSYTENNLTYQKVFHTPGS